MVVLQDLPCSVDYHRLTFSFLTGFTTGVNVVCPVKRYVVILFQPVTLRCDFTTTSTVPPLITWKYKSFCRDPIQAALNPSSADNTLAQSNPNYNPNIECSDSSRTVRIVASKQTAVTLGNQYQGRKISIINSKRQWFWYGASEDVPFSTRAIVTVMGKHFSLQMHKNVVKMSLAVWTCMFYLALKL